MKYIKGYKRFINESKIEIGKNALIVEKKVLEDFSSDFWNLCMKSAVFTIEEKSYIKENLSVEKVSLIKEEWKWLDNAIDWAKDKGEKMLNFITDKIKALRDGIKNFVSSMVAYAKALLSEGLSYAMKHASEIKKKFTGNEKLKKQINDLDPVQSKNEISDLTKTFQHWSPTIAAVANPAKAMTEVVIKISTDAMAKVDAQLKTSEAEAIASSTKNLEEAEQEAQAQGQNESITNILSSTNDDVLMSFYKLSLIKESEEAKEGEEEKKSVVDWILGFLGQENLDPEAKTGKKLLWWGKLFLKILSTCLSPILKVVEAAVKGGANVVLKGVSLMTAKVGGPGPFKFALLGGLCGGIIGLIYDTLMLFGSHATGTGTFAMVKAWLAHAINDALELFPDYKTLKYIFAGFCAGMTLWHVIEEIKHLAHGGHDDHGKEGQHKEETEAKPGATPAKPGAQAQTKPGTVPAKPGEPVKPATGTAAPPAA